MFTMLVGLGPAEEIDRVDNRKVEAWVNSKLPSLGRYEFSRRDPGIVVLLSVIPRDGALLNNTIRLLLDTLRLSPQNLVSISINCEGLVDGRYLEAVESEDGRIKFSSDPARGTTKMIFEVTPNRRLDCQLNNFGTLMESFMNLMEAVQANRSPYVLEPLQSVLAPMLKLWAATAVTRRFSYSPVS